MLVIGGKIKSKTNCRFNHKQELQMAKIVGPFHSDAAIGTVGLLTASVWRGMPVMRQKSMPKVSHILSIAENRALLGWLSREWIELSDAQRAEWKDYADNHPQPDGFGGTFLMTGQNAFIMLNHTAVRLDDDSAMQVTPPGQAPLATLMTFAAISGVTNPGDVDLTWTLPGTPAATDFVEIQTAGPFGSVAKVSVESRYAFKQSVAGNLLLDTVEDLVETKWYWFRARYVDEYGQVTAWQAAQATPKVTV